MLSTRAAAFAGKISNLRDSIMRIQNGTMPQPTCIDLSNMMKYFSQVLQDFKDFKDIENIPLYASEKKAQIELIKTLPNFDYCGLYKTLSQLVDILPLIPASANGLELFGGNLIMLFKCLVPFLEQMHMETMPYLVATLFMSLPQSLHKDILDTLCFNLLPFIIDQQQTQTAKLMSSGSANPGRDSMNRVQTNRQLSKSSSRIRTNSFTSNKSNNNNDVRTNSKPARVTSGKPDGSGKAAHCIVRIEDHGAHDTTRGPIVEARESQFSRSPSGSLVDQGQRLELADETTKYIDSNDENDDLETNENNNHNHGTTIDSGHVGGEDYDLLSGSNDDDDGEEYGTLSVTSILLISFHYIQEPMLHSQIIECLMKLKSNVFEDLLFVIAYGTTRAKCPAVELLFRYWPDICPSQQDRKNHDKSNKLQHVRWQHTKCQNKNCKLGSDSDNEAVKMCLDFKKSMAMSDLPPPMLICLDCVDWIYKDHMRSLRHLATTSTTPTIRGTGDMHLSAGSSHLNQHSESSHHDIEDYSNKIIDILLPMEKISKLCENKKCQSLDKRAMGTCFDIECANYNCKRPIRYCRDCFINIHKPSEANGYDVTLQTHIRHSSLNLTIMETDENINNFVEAIISLLKEASPADRPSKDSERYLRSLTSGATSLFLGGDSKDPSGNIATEERQLISQYGIWLMTGLLQKVERVKDELLGRLLGMLFQWFHFTACLPDDQAGSALEKLKGECIKGWIMRVKNQRMDVFISCLLPHPIDCSKVGGHWEVWPDIAHQIKEGFKRLLCLVPYDIITDDVWDEIMPYWMECFRHEVPENELSELKILLSKVFDPELSPLGFETKQMYNFISSRFEDPTNTNQEQTLYWLQIITMLEIPIPIDFLFQMLKSGVKSLAVIRSNDLAKLKDAMSMGSYTNKQSLSKATSSSKRNNNTRSNSEDEGDSGDDSSSLSDDSHRGSVLSEDNVLMSSDKAGSADDKQQPTRPPPLTQKERQANARAVFSAKLMQQATILDGGRSLSSSTSIPASPSMQSAITIATPGNLQQTLSRPQTSNMLNSTHSQPLKSTTSSLSDTQNQGSMEAAGPKKNDKEGASNRTKSNSKNKKTGKPAKLKLKLNMGEDELLVNKVDNNLICYILMLDITLKQLNLQEINSHKGLEAREAQQAIELLNTIVATPWVGRHTCSDTLPECTTDSAALKAQRSCLTETPGTGSQHGESQAGSSQLGSTDPHQQTQRGPDFGMAVDPLTKRRLQQETDDLVSANIHAFTHCASGFEEDDTLETCIFCEIISTFHQLSLSLIEYFSPLIEVSICEIPQDATNVEFDGKPDYSRIGLNHLNSSTSNNNLHSSPHGSPSPASGKLNLHSQGASKFNFDHHLPMNEASRQQYQLYIQFQKIPSTPYSPTYYGPSLKPEILSSLPNEIQLTYNLLIQFHQYQTPDIISQLLQMIKLISLHSQVLSKASKNNPQFIVWCQHNMLIAKLWSLCELESSEIARTCVPLLLHCITLPWGVRLIRDLLERDFNSDNWLQRFRAVERVVTIAQFSESSTIKNSTILQSTMASAFCYVVRCLDDIEAIVAQRALISLEMMKTSSLKLLLWCLEAQFDNIVIDRPLILRSVFHLYNHLVDRRFLTWEFFLNRFDTIFLESQIYLQQSGEIPSFTMQDLKNTNTKSEIYQRKITRAKEALQEIHHSRSLSVRFNERKHSAHGALNATTPKIEDQSVLNEQERYKHSLKLQRQYQSEPQSSSSHHDQTGGSSTNTNNQVSGGSKKAFHPLHQRSSPSKRVLQHGKSTSSRYQSVAYLISQSQSNRKNSKFMVNLAIQSLPPAMMLPDKLHQHLPNAFVDDGSKLNEIAQENHVFGVVHRICDEDRDTNHMIIFLLMQFFSKQDPSHPASSKTLTRIHQIVLKHLNILMGYSVARRTFLISAANLRLLPVFNAFLTSLPKVLDFNYQLGTILLDTCLPVLVYCPSPDEVASPPSESGTTKMPTYSLWLLNPLMRQSWLMSVLTFLYKYQFGQAHLKEHVEMLMWIVINTLESHLNCHTLEMTLDRYLVSLNRGNAGIPAGSSQGDPASKVMEDEAADALSTKQQNFDDNNLKAIPNSSDSPARARETKISEDSQSASNRNNQKSPENDNNNDDGKSSFKGSLSKILSPTTSIGSLVKSEQNQLPNQINVQKTLIKADTSDSLNVKAKLFQKKGCAESIDQLKYVDKSAKTTSLSNSKVDASVKVVPETISKQHSSIVCQDERLLPIGLDSGRNKPNQTPSKYSDQKERLLPIGIGCSSASTRTTKMGDKQQVHPIETVVNRNQQPFQYPNTLPRFGSYNSQQQQHQEYDNKQLEIEISGPDGKQSSINEPSMLSNINNTPGKRRFAPSMGKIIHGSDQAASLSGTSTSNKHHSTVSTDINAKDANADSLGNSSNLLIQDETTPSASSSKYTALPSSGGEFNSNNNNNNNNNKKKTKWGAKFSGKDYVPKVDGPMMAPSFSSPSLLNEQLAQINRHALVEEFSDKDLSLCLIILETFIHHEPSMAARMLPNILRLVARYSSANHESWQTGSNVHLVGGSMFVARQFVRVALHDLMENNIFQQIFTSHFTGYDFYRSMGTALADFPDLNQLTPLSKLFEDLNKQKNLPPVASLVTILENVATYFECIISESTNYPQTSWTSFLTNWENFLRKLVLALPRYSGYSQSPISSSANGPKLDTATSIINAGTGQGLAHGGGANATSGSGKGANVPQLFGGGGPTSGGPISNNKSSINNNTTTPNFQDKPINGGVVGGPANGLPPACSMITKPIMRFIVATTRISQLATNKTIVDPYSKIICYTVLNTPFKYEHLLEINNNCSRIYTRDREKYLIQRTIAYELMNVIKFRFFILEKNLLMLLLFILQDVGGTLTPTVLRDNLKLEQNTLNQAESYVTNISEALRQYMGDILEFIADVHAISRINDNLIGGSQSSSASINRDSFGGYVKAALAQYLALELSQTNGSDSRSAQRCMTWLFDPSREANQTAPRIQFIDCILHIRQVTWIILGSLKNSALSSRQSSGNATGSQAYNPNSGVLSQPIPIEKNSLIAEHVQIILAGFAEQSKESVLHMSGLFHAFLLCQLWTVYCETLCNQHAPMSEQYQFCQSNLDDFWSKITPGVLRLVGHSPVMSEMVSTHFLQSIESLIESNSSILIRYLPMWNCVFYSYKRRNKSRNLALRLQKCIDWQPPDLLNNNSSNNNENNNKTKKTNDDNTHQAESANRLLNWLEKVQYKMSHIEIQSSQAAPFYLT